MNIFFIASTFYAPSVKFMLFNIFYAFTPRSWFFFFFFTIFLLFWNFSISLENLGFFCFLLNISSGPYSRPKFSNPVERNPALKNFGFFRKSLLVWNDPRFRKIHRLSCNVGQFLNVQGNFLLPIGNDSFSYFRWNWIQFNKKIRHLVGGYRVFCRFSAKQ